MMIHSFTDAPRSAVAPWGHSKGMLAWNDAGQRNRLASDDTIVASFREHKSPRKTDGNTLGCVKDDNVQVSQHFFSLKLTKDDVTKVLEALQNASVVTDIKNPQIVKNGGPLDVQALVETRVKSNSTSYTRTSAFERGSNSSRSHLTCTFPHGRWSRLFLEGVP